MKEFYTVEIPLDVDIQALIDKLYSVLPWQCTIGTGKPGWLGFLFDEEIDELRLRRIVYRIFTHQKY